MPLTGPRACFAPWVDAYLAAVLTMPLGPLARAKVLQFILANGTTWVYQKEPK